MMEKPPMPKTPENNEEEDSRIMGASNFEELYGILSKLAVIPGHQSSHSADDLRRKIELVRHGERDITAVTRTFGLRKKVEHLLHSDDVYKKYVTAQRKP